MIRNKVHWKKIFVSIDETCDTDACYEANVINGTLEIGGPGEVFLLRSEVLKSINHSTICKLFDRSMFLLWPEGIRHDDVLLFVTDAAPYIVKAGKSIKSFYTKLVHVTCLAHALHRMTEEVRSEFLQVDALVSRTKKIFIKAPARKIHFKAAAPGVPLPPEPIITRWRTWTDAAIYHCDHFQIVKNIIHSMKMEDVRAIEAVQEQFSCIEMEGQLAFIKANFSSLTEGIQCLQDRGATLEDSLALVKKIATDLEKVSGDIGKMVSRKMKSVLDKNLGYETLCSISQILSGESFSAFSIEEELTASDLVHFKYAPVVSADVERSFSKYKNVLSDSRHALTFKNLRMLTVIYCNSE
ncbi:hypothetical protein B7P43_G11713 [Cryptotermes secundus]|uniref:DUF659 domain-containing protein n=1 Tax=Cryptotermes secundus TaxID=105785 RepID=A0A2J7PRT2_9NEOP|nr:hypothetical protein B7P43_G11713 [Cryptotermes secundus]